MRREELLIEVRDKTLARVGTITHQYLSMKASLRFCNVGDWELTLPAGHPMIDYLIVEGSGIVATLRDEVLFSGLTTNPEKTTDQKNPDGSYTFRGVTDEILLADGLAFPDVTTADVTALSAAYDVRTGNAESVMREYVAYNIGSSAVASRKTGLRSYVNLQAVNGNQGATVTKSARFDNLLSLLQEIAIQGGVGFRLVQEGSVLRFKVAEITDRTGLIRFDIQNGTVTSETIQVTPPSATRVVVGGQGEGIDRVFVQRTTVDSVAGESDWGRIIEVFKDQRGKSEIAELEGSGDEVLLDSGFTATNVKVATADDTTMVFNQDWYLGDRVTVVVNGQETFSTVTSAAVIVNKDAVMIGAGIGEVSGFDKNAALTKRVDDIDARVTNLETSEAGGGGGGLTEPVNSIQFDTTPTGVPTSVGVLSWNAVDKTLDLQSEGITYQLGQELAQNVKRFDNSGLTNGKVVYITGSSGANLLVDYALATSDATSGNTFAVMTADASGGAKAPATTFGLIRNIDTSALTEGAAVWLSGTVAGGMTTTKPTAPTHTVQIGFCVRSHATEGAVFVTIQNGYELEELHNVLIDAPADNEVLAYDSASSLWKNQTATEAGLIAESDSRLTDSRTPTGAAGGMLSGSYPNPNVVLPAILLDKNTTTVNLTSGSATQITSWDVEANNGFTYSAGNITVPAAGIYLVTATISYAANATGYRDSRIYVNGTLVEFARSNAISGTVSGVNSTYIGSLAANDVISLSALQNSGSTIAVSNSYTRFQVARLA